MKSSVALRAAPIQRLRKTATRARILRAARGLFSEFGYEAATIEQIAAAAGTRRSTLYTHFSDKNDILAAIVEDYLALVCEMISRLPPSPSRKEIDLWIADFAKLAERECVPTVLLIQTGATVHVPAPVVRFGEAMLVALAERLPAFHRAMVSGIWRARAVAVLRQLGASLVYHVDHPASAAEHLAVAGEWFDDFLRQADEQ